MRAADIQELASETVAETGLNVEVLGVHAVGERTGDFVIIFSEGYGSLTVRRASAAVTRDDIKTKIKHYLLSGPHE